MSQPAERQIAPRMDQPAGAARDAVPWAPPDLQAARTRLLDAAWGDDPVEIERAARSLKTAVVTAMLRQGLAASAAGIGELVRRLSGDAPVAPRTGQEG
jgi:hypothetical protein